MSFNLNKPKVLVSIIIAIIISLVILLFTAIFIKNKIVANKIENNIAEGSTNLNSGKINEAKENFNHAVSLRKENKETYILIKDEYLKSGRLDDALSILKEGKNNKITGLESLIKDVKQKFEVLNLEDEAYQNEPYSLPKKVKFNINNEETDLPVEWKNTKIDTNKLGDFVFEGVATKYEKSVKLTLHISAKIISTKEISASIVQGQEYKLPSVVTATFSDKTIKEVAVKWFPNKIDSPTVGTQNFIGTVASYEKKIKTQVIVKPKPIVYSKQIGYISDVYEEDGKRYLRYDDVIFLRGDAALQASIKNGTAYYENGEYFIDDDYCIINNIETTKRYLISDNASINLIGWVLYPDNGDIYNHPASYDTLKKCLSNNYGRLLCYIYTQNDVIVKVEGQYVP